MLSISFHIHYKNLRFDFSIRDYVKFVEDNYGDFIALSLEFKSNVILGLKTLCTLYQQNNNVRPRIQKLISNDNYYLMDISVKNYNDIGDITKKDNIDYAVIGAEGPLHDGLTDFLHLLNIKCIGPHNSYAKIEWDKYFARKLMQHYGLRKYNPRFKEFNPNLLESLDCSKLFFETIASFGNYVIKPVGLCGGKGVKTISITEKTGDLIAIKNVTDENDLMIIKKLSITLLERDFSIFA